MLSLGRNKGTEGLFFNHPHSCYPVTGVGYIELNPVRARMVDRPEEYRWSGHDTYARVDCGWLTPHLEYQRMGGLRRNAGLPTGNCSS
jgi:hypothetical protein